jgi:hypothetical protein
MLNYTNKGKFHIYPYKVLKYLGPYNSNNMFLPIKNSMIHIYPQNVKNILILCFYINEELFLKIIFKTIVVDITTQSLEQHVPYCAFFLHRKKIFWYIEKMKLLLT